MRLLYLTYFDLSIDDGPGINERSFMTSLILNKDIDLCCLLRQPKYPEKLPVSEKIVYLPGRLSGRLAYIQYQWDLIRWIKNVDKTIFAPDIIVLRPMLSNWVPLWVADTLACPITIKTLAGYSSFGIKHTSLFQKCFYKLSKRSFQDLISRAVYMDTPSVTYSMWLSDYFNIPKEKLAIIPNGADTNMFYPLEKYKAREFTGLSLYKKIIGYVGAINNLRNLDILPNVIQSLAAFYSSDELQVVLVGSGKQVKELKQRTIALGVERYFYFVGKVPYEDVPKWINSFDVAIDLTLVPMSVSFQDEPLNASYSQKVSQYLACGCPVIAMDSADTKFLAERDIGWLITPNNSNILYQSLLLAISLNNQEWSAISSRCVEYATSHLSADSIMTERIKNWYQIVG